jgi:hypothetical protein
LSTQPQTYEQALASAIAYQDELDRLVNPAPQWSPHKPYGRGKLFIDDLRDEKEAFYGGAAGGMKSDHLLQAALEYVDVPGYAAILFRRTYKDLSKPEALLSRAHEWLDRFVDQKLIRWNGEAHQFQWKQSGAVLAFGHMEGENDKLEHQSAAYQYVGFDEVTQFSETQYTYLFSRLRRPQLPCRSCFLPITKVGSEWLHSPNPDTGLVPAEACLKAEPNPEVLKQYGPAKRGKYRGLRIWDVPLRMRAASNPAEDYMGLWVAERFVPDDFVPAQAEEPRVFWKEGMDVKGRRVKRPFVPSRLEDNPFIDRVEYENALVELGTVTYEQLRRGDWRIRSKGNIYTAWNELYHVITWSEFEAIYGTRFIPSHWACGISQDWGTTQSHPCVTTLFATAPQNTKLPGKVFIPWALTLYDAKNAQQVARDYLVPELTRLNLYGSIHRWLMSHEAKSEMTSYNEMGLPFIQWGQDSCGGLDRVRRYLEIRDGKNRNPFGKRDSFGQELMGGPSLMFVVDDDQLVNPRDDKGLARHRAEIAGYSWHLPKAGDPPEKLRPQKLFNDAMDSIRCFAELQFPEVIGLTQDERIDSQMRAMGYDVQAPTAQLDDPMWWFSRELNEARLRNRVNVENRYGIGQWEALEERAERRGLPDIQPGGDSVW